MSVKQPSPLADHKIRTSAVPSERLLVPEHESIDERLKQLKEDVLPFYPFLLTVPTDVPFRLGGRLINDWAVGKEGPFTAEEQQLQYMTFLTHHEGDSLLVAVGDWSDEPESVVMDQQPERQSAAGIPPTSPGGLAKKRISLNDYKNKRNNGTPALPTGEDVGNRVDSEANSAENDNAHKHLDRKLSQSPIRTAPTSPGRKNSYEPQRERSNSPKRRHSETPSKRRRLSPEETTGRDSAHPQSNKLPALLSPTLPSISGGRSLPQLLSPTLPPDIERELASFSGESPALKSSQAKDVSAPMLPKSDVQMSKSPSHSTPHSDCARGPSDSRALRGRSPSAAYRGASAGLGHMEDVPTEASKAAILSQKADNSRQEGIHLPTAKSRAAHRPSQERPRLILKLRYGRSNRKRVEGLLKFSGKRKMGQAGSPSKERRDHRFSQSKKDQRHRPRLGREDRYGENARSRERSKELKAPDSEKPRPEASDSQPPSPWPPEHWKPKQASATPTKDLKGSAARRTEPAGPDDRLPTSQTAKPSRELGAAGKASLPRQSGQGSRPQDSERRAWKDEFHRCSNLGRELKHAAQRERQAAEESATSADEKRAVATAIEAILCFILAFFADDQSRVLARQVGESSNWLSILAYWRVVKSSSRPYPVLRSLCYMLGAVSYDAIHALDLERLAVSPVPGEHIATPTPGSDGDTLASDENRKTMKEFLELKSRLPECYKESQRLWLEGSRGLSEDVLVSEFPDTWSKRSRNYTERGKHQPKVGDYSADFFVPLERTSSPVEVVRFGWSILTEWCVKEKVNWKGRLGL